MGMVFKVIVIRESCLHNQYHAADLSLLDHGQFLVCRARWLPGGEGHCSARLISCRWDSALRDKNPFAHNFSLRNCFGCANLSAEALDF
jgi:hypothetical protein